MSILGLVPGDLPGTDTDNWDSVRAAKAAI